jgi:hypothetical protein
MNRIYISLLFTLYLFSSCVNFSEQSKLDSENQLQALGKIFFEERIDSILQKFVSYSKCDSCIYELFIDKKELNEYKLTMISLVPSDSYIKENNPVNYSLIDEKIFFVYSGVEDFVKKELYQPTMNIKKSNTIKKISSWSLVILNDTSYLVEDDWIPFINKQLKPTIIFKE